MNYPLGPKHPNRTNTSENLQVSAFSSNRNALADEFGYLTAILEIKLVGNSLRTKRLTTADNYVYLVA